MSAESLVTAGLMTDVPPCSCRREVAASCVHHGPAWIRICERLSELRAAEAVEQ